MEFLSTALTVIITAALTASLAMQQFKKERHWERQVKAYTEIRKSINSCLDYSEKFIDEYFGFPPSPNEKPIDQLLKERKNAIENIEIVIENEFYFLGPKTRDIISEYIAIHELPEHLDVDEIAKNDFLKASEILITVDRDASKDLALHSSNFSKIVFSCLKRTDTWLEPLAKRLQSKA